MEDILVFVDAVIFLLITLLPHPEKKDAFECRLCFELLHQKERRAPSSLFLQTSDFGPPPPPPAGECVPVPLPFGSEGTHSLAGEGGGVPILMRGQTLWYSRCIPVPIYFVEASTGLEERVRQPHKLKSTRRGQYSSLFHCRWHWLCHTNYRCGSRIRIQALLNPD
jgi:hypothetical protein